MANQTTTWTVLPTGVSAGASRGGPALSFSVHIAPRLDTGGADGQIGAGALAAWQDWPQTLSGLTFHLSFPDLGLSFPASIVSTPDSSRWHALFTNAPVRSYAFKPYLFDHIHSYPIAHIAGFLATQWGRFGATSPASFPSYTDLADDQAFGPIGFEDEHLVTGIDNGWVRKRKLIAALGDRYAAGPGGLTVPYDPDDANSPAGIATSFLQLAHFHQRGLTADTYQTKNNFDSMAQATQPAFDFHDAAALAGHYTTLPRLLGLVLDLVVLDPGIASLLAGNAVDTSVTMTVDGLPDALTTVLPVLACTVGGGQFAARSTAAAPTMTNGLLMLGDASRFQVVEVDADSSAIKALQFAGNLTRSRVDTGATPAPTRSFSTPDAYSMPALRSGGLSVAHLSRASAIATSMLGQKQMNADSYDTTNPTTPHLGLDDVIRGYRWDVADTADGTWRSLSARSGTYHFLRMGADGDLAVDEEAWSTTAMGTSGKSGAEDLYLQETLVKWNGWSLAVKRPGKSLSSDGDAGDDGDAIDEQFQFQADFGVTPGSLPRLRFGRQYVFRARAVDLAGNSLPADAVTDVNGGGPTTTPPSRFLRFEPVEAPMVLQHDPHTPGESATWIVVRSENAADNAVATSARHIAPAHISTQLAEFHGLLDATSAGHPMDPATYQILAQRDGVLPPCGVQEPAPNDSMWYYPTDGNLDVTWLPCPMTANAILSGLPSNGFVTAFGLPVLQTWPDARSFQLILAGSPDAGFGTNADGNLAVNLAKGDIYEVRLSAGIDMANLPLFGVWKWITAWVAANPAAGVSIADLTTAIADGQHWMITPGRTVTLVHAVRTPLLIPKIVELTSSRPHGPGSTDASLEVAIAISQKSTGRIDAPSHWTMPVDTGTNADPVTPQRFDGPGFTATVEHPIGAAEDAFTLTLRSVSQEFGDTKFRAVHYVPTATSAFVEYFRETAAEFTLAAPLQSLPFAFEPTTLELRTGETTWRQAALNTTDGDYGIDPVTFAVMAYNPAMVGASMVPSYVAPNIHATGVDAAVDVLSTARPAAPVVDYAVPAFAWSSPVRGTSIREGGGIRVYLERPWWSSGDGETLGVVLWPAGAPSPSAEVQQYVTMTGLDPTSVSGPLVAQPGTGSFPLAVNVRPGVAFPDLPGVTVDVAEHAVSFDAARDLWFCDIQVDVGGGNAAAYYPFIRFALCRYQAKSLPSCDISKVALADFIQLSPRRAATVTGSGATRTVTVVGTGYSAGSRPGSSDVRVIVERRMTNVPDATLGWSAVGTPKVLAKSSSGTTMTWLGGVTLPSAAGTYRLVIEEYETHDPGNQPIIGTDSSTVERVVYTDILAA